MSRNSHFALLGWYLKKEDYNGCFRSEGINKEIIAETDVTENRNGTNYKIGKKYTLKLSNFEQKNRFGQTTDYLNWSGQTSIRIAEDVIEDTSGNKNLQETIDGEYVDFVSPAMLYNYLTTDVDYEQKSVTIKFLSLIHI